MPRKRSSLMRNKNKRKDIVLKSSNPMWMHDSALLDRSFPDTQIWNNGAEHEPRFGQTNSKDGKIFNLVQSAVNRQWLTSSSGGATGNAIAFTLSGNVNQATTLTSLFDQYRIMQVELWLKPSTSFVSNSNVATLYSVIDYDDAINPTTEDQMQQYTNVTVTSLNEGVYRRFRPHIETAAYATSVFTAFKNEKSAWIDSASPGVSHYGFKALITTITGGNISYDLTYRIWTQHRNVF